MEIYSCLSVRQVFARDTQLSLDGGTDAEKYLLCANKDTNHTTFPQKLFIFPAAEDISSHCVHAERVHVEVLMSERKTSFSKLQNYL